MKREKSSASKTGILKKRKAQYIQQIIARIQSSPLGIFHESSPFKKLSTSSAASRYQCLYGAALSFPTSVSVPAGHQDSVLSTTCAAQQWVALFPTSRHKEFLQLWVRQHSLSSLAMSAINPSSRGGKQDPQSVIPEMGECSNQTLSC